MKRPNAWIATTAAIAASFGLAAAGNSAGVKEGRGEQFYNEKVLPALAANGCAACHGQHYVRPRVLEYRELLPYLGMGSSAEDNVLLYKMANLRSFRPDRPSHPGGKRCASIDADPCRTFREWWHVEFDK